VICGGKGRTPTCRIFVELPHQPHTDTNTDTHVQTQKEKAHAPASSETSTMYLPWDEGCRYSILLSYMRHTQRRQQQQQQHPDLAPTHMPSHNPSQHEQHVQNRSCSPAPKCQTQAPTEGQSRRCALCSIGCAHSSRDECAKAHKGYGSGAEHGALHAASGRF
jgi:hypothetical protein